MNNKLKLVKFDTQIAKTVNKSKSSISHTKRTNKPLYDALKIATLLNINNIEYDELILLLNNKSTNK